MSLMERLSSRHGRYAETANFKDKAPLNGYNGHLKSVNKYHGTREVEKVKILLVDADSVNGFPNLALMKLSAYHKSNDHKVDLIVGLPEVAPLFEYDHTYVSCIFYQNKDRVMDYASQFKEISLGGSGIYMDFNLPPSIEHIMPDYKLYGTDYSMGFTSRGCPRKCSFCDVSEKEGTIRDHAPISEFLHPDHKKLVLLDNNFLASPEWLDNMKYIVVNDLMVNFCQGLDIRLMTKMRAHWLSRIQYYNWTFNRKGLHFAFDHPSHQDSVVRGIEILNDVGIRPYRSMFYILVGFNTTPEQDMHRIMKIKELGAKPFVMIYNRNDDHELRRLARWVNGRFHEFLPYDTFKLEGEHHIE